MRMGVVLAMLAAALAVCAPASAQNPTLAGTNVISGDRSGYLDVRIPGEVPMSFDWRPEKNTTFAIGSEGFAGVMLRRLGGDTLVAAARFEPSMLCPACTDGESLIVGIQGVERQTSTDFTWTIPAGD